MPSSNDLDYMADLEINKYQLDAEWIHQPALMMSYSEAHAQAQFDRDRAKQNLDVVKARLDAAIRAEFTTAQTKFTEAVVDGRIKTSKEFLEAQNRLQAVELKVNLYLGAVMAFNARKIALENLVKLFLSGYWAEPRLPLTEPRIGDQTMDENTRDINNALNREPRLPLRRPIKG